MARYRRLRTDFHTHPRTRGLSPLARDIFVQGIESNIAGILERSIRKLASLAGGETTDAQVRCAIRELVERGLARWWSELEILWVIEAADEQSQNTKAWSAVLGVIENSPREVVAAFAHRYPDKVPKSDAYTVFHQEQDQEQNQEQEQDQAPGDLGGAHGRPSLRFLSSENPDVVVSPTVIIEQTRCDWGDLCEKYDPDRTTGIGYTQTRGKALAGLLDAVRTYGDPIVRAVHKHACEGAFIYATKGERFSGSVDPRYYGAMFCGNGFRARYDDYSRRGEQQQAALEFKLTPEELAAFEVAEAAARARQ